MTDVATFYNNVIDDVISGMRETFTEDGLDLEVLQELKKLWSSKLADTHVADPEPVAQPAPQYAQRLQAAQYQQTCVASVPFSRLPIQPNNLGQPTSLRTLAPIARANAPLTATNVANIAPGQSGYVLRTAVGTAQVARQPIVLAAALNPQQQQATQQRVANPVSIAIRGPLQGTPTIIGQAGMASVNGMQQFGIPGYLPPYQAQDGQLLQVGQQTFVLPFQIRPQIQGTQHIHQDATADQILQNQTFNRTQVDGVCGDSDFDDDDLDDLDEPPPSLHHGSAASTQRNNLSVAATPRSVRQLSTNDNLDDDDDDDDEDDDDGFVPATPGVAMTPGMTPAGGPMSVACGGPPSAATPRGGGKRIAGIGGKLGSKKLRFGGGGGEDEYEEGPINLMTSSQLQGGDTEDPRSPVVPPASASSFGSGTSRRKQKTPANRRLASNNRDNDGRANLHDHHHVPELPPPEVPPPLPGARDGAATDDPAVAADEAAVVEEEDEEPLNSDDDVSEEEPESLFQTDNLVVCQYEKVSRTRSKWRFVLRDGIMKIRGRDHIFSKLNGEADWLIGSGTSGVSS